MSQDALAGLVVLALVVAVGCILILTALCILIYLGIRWGKI